MGEWWEALSATTQWFYVAAAFFSVFLVWQLIAAIAGLAGDHDVDADGHADAGDVDASVEADHDVDHEVDHDAGPDSTEVAFRLLSVRSIVAFCTLFSWAGALYLTNDEATETALTYAIFWGFAGMFAVAGVLHFLMRLTSSGTRQLHTSVGRRGVVYVDIPADGPGEVRVVVSGAVSYVKARSAGEQALKAGTPVRVVRTLGSTAIEVEPEDEPAPEQEERV